MKKAGVILVSAIMTLALGVTAFAQGFDIGAGDVTINQDGSYVITGTSSTHNIVVIGANVTITLDNVNITTSNKSAIDIDDNSDVQLIVSGANSLTVTNTNTKAGIHVSGGSLTISGSDADDDILTVLNAGSNGATIGSNGTSPYSRNEQEIEDFTGSITIDGGVTVNAGYSSMYFNDWLGEAGIGSGTYGDMSGTITINEGSVVNAGAGDEGAGIGAGEFGDMSGTIIINGGEVNASSYCDGAGIGSGDVGDMSGTIIINGGDVTAYGRGSGAGIGSGYIGDYYGISGTMTGSIIINGGTISAYSGYGSGIGSGQATDSGDIIIHGDAEITLGDDYYNNIIGSFQQSTGTIYLYKGATINGITVADIDELKEAGILNDNMNVELLEEGTEDVFNSGSSYSLGKLNIVSRIKAASAGDKIYVYESELTKSKLPYYVLEELAKMDDVTLVIVSEDGETVEIHSSNIPEKGRYAFFTVDELLAM